MQDELDRSWKEAGVAYCNALLQK